MELKGLVFTKSFLSDKTMVITRLFPCKFELFLIAKGQMIKCKEKVNYERNVRYNYRF